MKKIESILGTTKREAETWSAVYSRLNTAGGIDSKTVARLVFAILDILDEKK